MDSSAVMTCLECENAVRCGDAINNKNANGLLCPRCLSELVEVPVVASDEPFLIPTGEPMKHVPSLLAMLCVLCFACGSLQAAPPQAPPVALDYFEAAQLAASQGKPLVTFRGCTSHPVAGAVVCEVTATDSRFAGFPANCVVTSKSAKVVKLIGLCSGKECSGATSCSAGGSCSNCSACTSASTKSFAPTFSAGGCASGNCGQQSQRMSIFRR